jgi:hypothetical protein
VKIELEGPVREPGVVGWKVSVDGVHKETWDTLREALAAAHRLALMLGKN